MLMHPFILIIQPMQVSAGQRDYNVFNHLNAVNVNFFSPLRTMFKLHPLPLFSRCILWDYVTTMMRRTCTSTAGSAW